MADQHQNEDLTSFLEIPVELRAKILEKMDSNSLLQMRLSCKDIKTIIDHYVGVDAFMSEICLTQVNLDRQFEFFSNVALRNIYIGVMNGSPGAPQNIPTSKLSWSWWLKNRTFQDLFRYPEYIQRVTCNCEISFWLLQEIMKNCFNMKSLEFNPKSKIHGILTFVHPQEIELDQNYTEKLHYKKLETLLLSTIDLNEKRQACQNSITILRSVRSCALKQFKFECWPAASFEVFNELMDTLKDFMIFHENLKTVNLIFRLTTVMQDTTSFAIYSEKLYRNLTEIAASSQTEVFGLDVYSKSDWIWKPLLKCQRRLKTVQFTTLLSATVWNFQGVFSQSFNTLTRLSLQVYVPLQYRSFHPIDLSGLEVCVNLKEVSILNKSINIRSVHNFHPFLIHLDCVPSKIETLVISYVIIETEDIINLLKNLNSLKNLVLINSVLTRFSTYGVNSQCLQDILSKRSIESLLLAGLNLGNTTVECISNILGNSQDESESDCKMIAFDLEIISKACPFTWTKEALDNRPLGYFYTSSRKVPYMGVCQ